MFLKSLMRKGFQFLLMMINDNIDNINDNVDIMILIIMKYYKMFTYKFYRNA